MIGLGIAAAVILIIALLPVGITARFDGEDTDIRLIIGPFRRKAKPSGINYLELIDTLYAAEEEIVGTSAGQGSVVRRFLSQLRSLVMLLSEARQIIKIRRLELKLILGGDDPCDVALAYGATAAAVWNLLGALDRLFVIQKRDVDIGCDFESTQTLVTARLDFTLPVYRLVTFLWRYVVRLVRIEMKKQNKQKGGTV